MKDADIYDEFGNHWRVRAGNPAARLVSRLTGAGYALIVLPLRTLFSGVPCVPVCEPENVIHATRLHECLEVLLP